VAERRSLEFVPAWFLLSSTRTAHRICICIFHNLDVSVSACLCI
jgi:hypothetical protein